MTEPEHVCRPGASVYYCPTGGSTESDCHGGFDVCCDQPDLHQPVIARGGNPLDVRRRYLIAVGSLFPRAEPQEVHLALYSFHERIDDWLVGQALCGISVASVPLGGGAVSECPGCAEYLPTYEQALGQELAALHGRARDRTARAHAGDTVENGAWHTVWLETRWEWVTSKMTTPQREYAADRVAAYGEYLAALDGEEGRGEPDGLRWWRSAGRGSEGGA